MRNKTRKNGNLLLSGGGLLLALSNLSLLSIGFSSWSYGTFVNAKLPVNATVGEVESLFSSLSVKMFSLGPDGLVDNETIVTSSKIEASFYFDNVKAKAYGNGSSLSFKAILSCDNSSFLSTYIGNPTISGSSNLSFGTDESGLWTSATYPVLSSGKTKVTVVYTVTDQANAEGETMADLYYPIENRPVFSFSVRGS